MTPGGGSASGSDSGSSSSSGSSSGKTDPPAERGSDHDGWTVGAEEELAHQAVHAPARRKDPWKKLVRRRPDASDRSSSTEAIALVSQSLPWTHPVDLATEMKERYALGDFSGALAAAELLVGRGEAVEEARHVAETSRAKLVAHYLSRLGGPARMPRLAVAASDVRWLGIDHRAGFLLSQIDGATTTEALLDLSGMSTLETLKTLVDLVDAGAVRFD